MRASSFGHTAKASFEIDSDGVFVVRILVLGRPIPQPRHQIGAKVLAGGKTIQRKWIPSVKVDGVKVRHPIAAYKKAIQNAFFDLAGRELELRRMIPLEVPIRASGRFFFAPSADGLGWPDEDGVEPYTGVEDSDNLIKAPLDALTVPKASGEAKRRDPFGLLENLFLIRDDRFVFFPVPLKLVDRVGKERSELTFRWRPTSRVRR